MRFLSTFKHMPVPATFPTDDATLSPLHIATIAIVVDALHVYSEIFRVAAAAGPGRLPAHASSIIRPAEDCWPIAWQWITYILMLETRSSVLRVPINMSMAQTRHSLSRVLRPDDVLVHYSINSKLHVGHILYSAVANLPSLLLLSVVTTPGLVEMMTRMYASYAARTDITTLMRMWHTTRSVHMSEEVLDRVLRASPCTDTVKHHSRRLLCFLQANDRPRSFLIMVALTLQFIFLLVNKTMPSGSFSEVQHITSQYLCMIPVCEEAIKVSAQSLAKEPVDQEGISAVFDHCCIFLSSYPYRYSWLKAAIRRGMFSNMVRCWMAVPEVAKPPFLQFTSTTLAPALLYLPVLRSLIVANKTYNLESIYCSSECIQRAERFPVWKTFIAFSESCAFILCVSLESWSHCGFCRRDTSVRQKQKRCGGCQMACYCSRQCQKAAWRLHRVDCLSSRSDIAGTKWLAGDFQPNIDKYGAEECFILSHHLSRTNRTFIREFIRLSVLAQHKQIVDYSDFPLEALGGQVYGVRFDFTKVEDFTELAEAHDGMLRSTVKESYSRQYGVDILVALPIGGPFNWHTVIVSHEDLYSFLSPPRDIPVE